MPPKKITVICAENIALGAEQLAALLVANAGAAAAEIILLFEDREGLQKKLSVAEEDKANWGMESIKLQQQVELLEGTVTARDASINEMNTLIEEQAMALGKFSDNGVTDVTEETPITVNHYGSTYVFRKKRFRIAGDQTLHTAEEAAQKPELIAKIIAMDLPHILQEQV